MKKNIGILSWSLNTGGAERAAANLSKDLSEKYNVYLIVFDARNIMYPYGGTLVDIAIPSAKNPMGKIINYARRIKRIKEIKKQYDIHLIISFMPHVNLYNILSKGHDVTILSIRNNMSEKEKSSLKRKLIKWCGNKAEMTVSLSDGVRKDLIENFSYQQEKVVTIYNSCDVKWFYSENAEIDKLIENFDFTKPTIVTVGRLTHQKGQWHLLRALSELKKDIPNIQLVVFGEGEYRIRLLEYAKKLGICENVFFMGYVKNHHKFMKQCDVFVFPSIFEGLGNVLLEALACGLPIVSTDCPSGPGEILCGNATDDIVYTDYGVLIPKFSQKSFDENDIEFEKSDHLLATALLKILTSPEMKSTYINQALKRAQDFTPENIKGQWESLIGEYD